MVAHLGFLDFLVLLGSVLAAPLQSRAGIGGEIIFSGADKGPVVVAAYRLAVNGEGIPQRLDKSDVLGGKEPARSVTIPGPGPYEIAGLEEGFYNILAFMDLDGDGALDFDPEEPFGWYAVEPAGPMTNLELGAGAHPGMDVVLWKPRPFPADGAGTEHGSLRWMKGLPVLQLSGTAEERGFAHGFLVGEQILDFFQFYVLEDSWRSARRYEEEFVPFLETHFTYDPEYLAEVDAVVQGMRSSGMDMEVAWLGRDFDIVDLLAVNAYIERRAAAPSPPPSDGPACSQFAFWGSATEGRELRGGLIAGRNMDGEVDLRKVTVSHFLVFAVDPSEPGRRRWVSTMWPGFVGSLSGMNEEGLYSMENAGGTGPGPVVDGLTPCTWVQRYILENAGAESTPQTVGELVGRFASAGGGTFGAGSIILWAVPYHGQEAPAFVSEGDRFGTAIRLPAEVPPLSPFDIMATNHYLSYGVEPGHPGLYFGKEASFSSLWRYEVGMNTMDAWTRQGRAVGTDEMRRLLQSVAHGTTEYSVIFRANELTLDVVRDDLGADLWDAPYQAWTTFQFEELFEGIGN